MWRTASGLPHVKVCLMCRTASCEGLPHVKVCLMCRTVSCEGLPHVKDCLMWRTASCAGLPHVKGCLMWRTASCEGLSHVKDCLMCRTAWCEGVPDVKDCLMWRTASCAGLPDVKDCLMCTHHRNQSQEHLLQASPPNMACIMPDCPLCTTHIRIHYTALRNQLTSGICPWTQPRGTSLHLASAPEPSPEEPVYIRHLPLNPAQRNQLTSGICPWTQPRGTSLHPASAPEPSPEEPAYIWHLPHVHSSVEPAYIWHLPLNTAQRNQLTSGTCLMYTALWNQLTSGTCIMYTALWNQLTSGTCLMYTALWNQLTSGACPWTQPRGTSLHPALAPCRGTITSNAEEEWQSINLGSLTIQSAQFGALETGPTIWGTRKTGMLEETCQHTLYIQRNMNFLEMPHCNGQTQHCTSHSTFHYADNGFQHHKHTHSISKIQERAHGIKKKHMWIKKWLQQHTNLENKTTKALSPKTREKEA